MPTAHLDACTEELRKTNPHSAANCYGTLQELQIPSRQGPDGKFPEEHERFWHAPPKKHQPCG